MIITFLNIDKTYCVNFHAKNVEGEWSEVKRSVNMGTRPQAKWRPEGRASL